MLGRSKSFQIHKNHSKTWHRYCETPNKLKKRDFYGNRSLKLRMATQKLIRLPIDPVWPGLSIETIKDWCSSWQTSIKTWKTLQKVVKSRASFPLYVFSVVSPVVSPLRCIHLSGELRMEHHLAMTCAGSEYRPWLRLFPRVGWLGFEGPIIPPLPKSSQLVGWFVAWAPCRGHYGSWYMGSHAESNSTWIPIH